jgi:hypothetical protein
MDLVLTLVLTAIAFVAGQWFGYRYGAMQGRAEGYTARRIEEIGKR